MPHDTSYVEPALFIVHQDVPVYHPYKGDDVNNGPYCYWFTTDPLEAEDEFDVRELPGWLHDDAQRASVIIQAIEDGIITKFIPKE